MIKSRQKDLNKEYQYLIDRHKREMKKSLTGYLQINDEGIEEIFSGIHFKCYEGGTVNATRNSMPII